MRSPFAPRRITVRSAALPPCAAVILFVTLLAPPEAQASVDSFTAAGATDAPIVWGDEAAATAATGAREAGSGFTVTEDRVVGKRMDFRFLGGEGVAGVRARHGTTMVPLWKSWTLDRTIPVPPVTPGLLFSIAAQSIRIEAHDHPAAPLAVVAEVGISRDLRVTLVPAEGLTLGLHPTFVDALRLASGSTTRGVVFVAGGASFERAGSDWVAVLAAGSRVFFVAVGLPGAPTDAALAAFPPALLAVAGGTGGDHLLDLLRDAPWPLEAGRDAPNELAVRVTPEGTGLRTLWLVLAGLAGPPPDARQVVVLLDGAPATRVDAARLGDVSAAGRYATWLSGSLAVAGVVVAAGRETEVSILRDEVAPTLVSHEVVLATADRLRFRAELDELAGCVLVLAPAGGAEVEVTSAASPARTHLFDVTGTVRPSTEYRYHFRMTDLAGNEAISDEFRVATPATGAFPEPVVDRFVPPDGARLDDSPTWVGAAFHAPEGESLALASVRLFVDGAEVTPEATVSDGLVRWDPPVPLGDGRHEVRVDIATERGAVVVGEWSFTVGVKDSPMPPLAAPIAFVLAFLAAARGRRRPSAI